MLQVAFILTFIEQSFVIKIFILSIFVWPFYIGFTVHICADVYVKKLENSHLSIMLTLTQQITGAFAHI